MTARMSASRIVSYETVAFLTIIAISWVSEFCDLEDMLFGRTYSPPNWRNPLIETTVTLLVGVPTILLSRHLSKRLHYLEGFLRVCAWCHRVGQDDDWIPLEKYVKKTFNTETTHGICPSCSQKLKRTMRR